MIFCDNKICDWKINLFFLILIHYWMFVYKQILKNEFINCKFVCYLMVIILWLVMGAST